MCSNNETAYIFHVFVLYANISTEGYLQLQLHVIGKQLRGLMFYFRVFYM